jgi:hypothetical protein
VDFSARMRVVERACDYDLLMGGLALLHTLPRWGYICPQIGVNSDLLDRPKSGLNSGEL